MSPPGATTTDANAALLASTGKWLGKLLAGSDQPLLEESLAMASKLEHAMVSNREQHYHSFGPGEAIIQSGTVGKSMFFIQKGDARVCSEDLMTTYGFLDAGAGFGDVGLLLSQNRTASIVAYVETACWELTQEVYEKVAGEFPDLSSILIRLLSEQVVEDKPFQLQ